MVIWVDGKAINVLPRECLNEVLRRRENEVQAAEMESF